MFLNNLKTLLFFCVVVVVTASPAARQKRKVTSLEMLDLLQNLTVAQRAVQAYNYTSILFSPGSPLSGSPPITFGAVQ